MARGLKFRIKEVEGLFYRCSENKGADKLRGYREADLCLCFHNMQNVGFLMTRLISFSSKPIIYVFLLKLSILTAEKLRNINTMHSLILIIYLPMDG